MTCRECGKRSCTCVIVPRDALHLALPAWHAVTLIVSGAMSDAGLRPYLQERSECVVGLNAPLPVADVEIFPDAQTALTQARTTAAGRWCAALPLCEPARREKGTPYRGLLRDRGIGPISIDRPYAVISHNWPRAPDAPLVHASVLGIWWAIQQPSLRQAETALTLTQRADLPVWIDFLCIDQENSAEKRLLLPEMGRIFSTSAVGFIDCTRTPVISTIDVAAVEELLAIGKPGNTVVADDDRLQRFRAISTAPWFTRCWTFQEELLSPNLRLYDPAHDAEICDFGELRDSCIREFHHMHEIRRYQSAKNDGWFSRAASFVNNLELINGNTPWNVGNVLTIRGRRAATEACDQLNSLLGILQARCNYRDALDSATEFTDASFAAFLQSCSNNEDTSWLVGEDPPEPVRHLSWAPSIAAQFTTQAEAGCVKWLDMTEQGPVLQFHRAFPVAEIIRIGRDATAYAMLVRLQSRQVSGAWLLEYCGIAFAADTHAELPLSPTKANALFAADYGSYRELEAVLIERLPWRAKEFENYLLGMPEREGGSFNAWIVFDTPSRRVAVMAKLIAPDLPREVLFGYPATSKYRSSHSFCPVVAVDGSSPCRRVGWVWPCCHATLTPPEAESTHCVRWISV